MRYSRSWAPHHAVFLAMLVCATLLASDDAKPASSALSSRAAAQSVLEPPNAMVLRRGNNADPTTLDPHKSQFAVEQAIEHDLYEGLVIHKPNGGITGGAAEAWTISADGTVYTFRLRRGLKWSNGEAITADDFVYSLRRLFTPSTKSPTASLGYAIVNAEEIATGRIPDVAKLGVTAPAQDVIEIKLKSPAEYFLSALANSAFVPVNRRAVEKYGDKFTQPETFVGNGAYTLSAWFPKDRVVLKKNPLYWDAAKVRIPEVQFLTTANSGDEFKRFQAGEIDITWDVPGDQLPLIRSEYPEALHIFPYLGNYYFAFDLTRPPFRGNPKLRQALSMVIDREAITQKITGAGEPPAYNWIPLGMPDYKTQFVWWKGLSQAERVAEAKRLMSESGYDPARSEPITIQSQRSELHRKIATAIAENWKQYLGVSSTFVEIDRADPSQSETAKPNVRRAGFIADYEDANNFAEVLRTGDGSNDFGYSNPEYDRLVQEAAATAEKRKRIELLERAEQIALADMPVIPVYGYVLKKLVRPTVKGYSPNVLGHVYSKDIWLAATGRQTERVQRDAKIRRTK